MSSDKILSFQKVSFVRILFTNEVAGGCAVNQTWVRYKIMLAV